MLRHVWKLQRVIYVVSSELMNTLTRGSSERCRGMQSEVTHKHTLCAAAPRT